MLCISVRKRCFFTKIIQEHLPCGAFWIGQILKVCHTFYAASLRSLRLVFNTYKEQFFLDNIMNNITFQYPAWYLILCLALGIGYAFLLYFRDKTFRDQSDALTWGLGIIRALGVAFLSSLLLSPLLKSLLTQTQSPIVVVAQDVSESVAAEMSAADLATYKSNLANIRSNLGEDYEVVEYSFGSEVREGLDTAYIDKVSNLSEMLKTVYDVYSNQNLGALVLASDGIYNEGSNPIYISTKLNAPIYSIALGDTIPKRDLVLKRVFHNKIAYLNDRFAIQVDVAAQNSVGKNTNLIVSKIVDGKAQRLESIPIAIDKNDFFTTKEVTLTADKAGVQRYRVTLGRIEGEASTGNNTKDFFIDVLDARQKILLLANSPHPDITALKQTLEQNKNYEITTAYASDLKEQIAKFDFVVLHQLPSGENPINAVRTTLKDKKIPHFYILGNQTSLGAFNQAQNLLSIQGDGRNTDEAQPLVQSDFSLFTIDENLVKEVKQFTPLTTPFGEYNTNPNASVLLTQRIGRIETKKPMLLIGEDNGTKVGVLAGEGLWRWRLFDYLQHQNHDIFNELIGKTIQFVSLKEDKRRFRVNLDKNIFDENEQVIFGAELYNESYELVNEPDVSLVVSSRDGKNYNFVFDKANQSYSLNARILPVGNYTYKGTTVINGEQLTHSGQFSVQPIQLELYATTANHGLLRILSEEYGGELLYPTQVNGLADRIKAKGTVKPVMYQTTKTRSIINLKWIFFVLLGLLSLEWFLRRYFGAY